MILKKYINNYLLPEFCNRITCKLFQTAFIGHIGINGSDVINCRTDITHCGVQQ